MYGLFLACLMGICGSPAAPAAAETVSTMSTPPQERLDSAAPAPCVEHGAAAALTAAALPGRQETPPRAARAVVSTHKVSRAEIAAVVQQGLGAIRRCYEAGLVEDGELSGVVEVGWKIATDGHVTTVNIVDSPRHNTALEGCLLGVISAWEFPLSSEPVVVGAYPFVLDATLLARRGLPSRISPTH